MSAEANDYDHLLRWPPALDLPARDNIVETPCSCHDAKTSRPATVKLTRSQKPELHGNSR